MMTKAKLVAAALVFAALGVASTAQAANDNQSRDRGGADIGPMGQCFVPPDCGGSHYRYSRHGYGRYGYDFVPGWRYRHEWRYR